MKFNWCTIKVNNLEESIVFYEEIVGLELDQRYQAGPDKEIAFLGKGETKVELIKDEGISSVNIGSDISLGFEVNSVDEKIAFLKTRNITVKGDIIKPNPHVQFFYIKDPNGLTIQFVQHM
ncbi:MAG: glyoxalase [Anaerocolumna sp.]|jgi:lactoylglutathione lyase|nr:glyoxalase [Anaerocolumna sp.]